jgi:hypothetical protein
MLAMLGFFSKKVDAFSTDHATTPKMANLQAGCLRPQKAPRDVRHTDSHQLEQADHAGWFLKQDLWPLFDFKTAYPKKLTPSGASSHASSGAAGVKKL